MNTNLLSVNDVAKLFQRSLKWVYKHKAEIPGYCRIAGGIFFDGQILTEQVKNTAINHLKNIKKSAICDTHRLLD